MSLRRVCFLLGVLAAWPAAADPVCAKNFSELDRTPQLSSLKTILVENGKSGFVNKTEGSYFFIQSSSRDFQITFYTTGLFDMYGIHREGAIYFCDDNGQLTAIGIERNQKIFLENGRLEFGNRSARESFIRGPMPEKLARVNELDARQLASY